MRNWPAIVVSRWCCRLFPVGPHPLLARSPVLASTPVTTPLPTRATPSWPALPVPSSRPRCAWVDMKWAIEHLLLLPWLLKVFSACCVCTIDLENFAWINFSACKFLCCLIFVAMDQWQKLNGAKNASQTFCRNIFVFFIFSAKHHHWKFSDSKNFQISVWFFCGGHNFHLSPKGLYLYERTWTYKNFA